MTLRIFLQGKLEQVDYLAYHGVEVMIEQDGGYTPTLVISHAILTDVCKK